MLERIVLLGILMLIYGVSVYSYSVWIGHINVSRNIGYVFKKGGFIEWGFNKLTAVIPVVRNILKVKGFPDMKGYIVNTSLGGWTLQDFQDKRFALESSLGEYIYAMNQHPRNPSILSIVTTRKALPERWQIDIPDFLSLTQFTQGTPHFGSAYFYDDFICFGRTFGDMDVGFGYDDLIHVLIGGTSGGGKTVLIKYLLCQIMYQKHLACVIDLKGGIDFSWIKSRKIPIITSQEFALKVLQRLVQVHYERIQILRNCGAAKISAMKPDKQPPRIFVIADEVAELLSPIDSTKPAKELVAEIEKCLSIIARLSRATGIHLICATQKPTVDIIKAQIRENLATRIAFRMTDTGSSLAILGDASAAGLPHIAGRCIVRSGSNDFVTQVPYITNRFLEAMFKNYRSEDGKDGEVSEENNQALAAV